MPIFLWNISNSSTPISQDLTIEVFLCIWVRRAETQCCACAGTTGHALFVDESHHTALQCGKFSVSPAAKFDEISNGSRPCFGFDSRAGAVLVKGAISIYRRLKKQGSWSRLAWSLQGSFNEFLAFPLYLYTLLSLVKSSLNVHRMKQVFLVRKRSMRKILLVSKLPV